MKIKLLVLLMLMGCGPQHKPKPKKDIDVLDQLYNKKVELLHDLEVIYGWVGEEDCDGLLWNGLALVGGADINIHQAESDGRWYRRPSKDCYPDESASSISNDMITGLLYGLWASEDYDAVNRLYKYGKDNVWVMGSGVISRTLLRPNGIYLITRMIERLGGPRKPELDNPATVNVYLPVSKDFEYHIQTVGMMLTVELEGYATDQIIDRLHEAIAKYPNDALFRAALGLFKPKFRHESKDLLLSLNYLPPSYVRNNMQHMIVHQLFTIYLLQRGFSHD